jgi:hypothetical protein
MVALARETFTLASLNMQRDAAEVCLDEELPHLRRNFVIVFGEADPPWSLKGGTVAAATPQRVGRNNCGFAA